MYTLFFFFNFQTTEGLTDAKKINFSETQFKKKSLNMVIMLQVCAYIDL